MFDKHKKKKDNVDHVGYLRGKIKINFWIRPYTKFRIQYFYIGINKVETIDAISKEYEKFRKSTGKTKEIDCVSDDTHRRILVPVHRSDPQQDRRIKLCLTKKRYPHTDKWSIPHIKEKKTGKKISMTRHA